MMQDTFVNVDASPMAENTIDDEVGLEV